VFIGLSILIMHWHPSMIFGKLHTTNHIHLHRKFSSKDVCLSKNIKGEQLYLFTMYWVTLQFDLCILINDCMTAIAQKCQMFIRTFLAPFLCLVINNISSNRNRYTSVDFVVSKRKMNKYFNRIKMWIYVNKLKYLAI
jgi:hypothetical protein